MTDRTRYQVMVNIRASKGIKAIEGVERLDKNFPDGQKRQAKAYQRKLQKAGYDVSFWDCRNNGISNMFAGVFSR